VIVEVDDALCLLFGRSLPEGTVVRIDAPKPGWQTEPPVRAIDLFLFSLRDVPPSRDGATNAYALSYLVTARAAKVREEHDLLDRALHTVLANAVLGRDCFPPGFDYPDDEVRLIVTSTDPGALWTSIGMPARAGFVATVTAPFNGRRFSRC
jgi:hypothetical protein